MHGIYCAFISYTLVDILNALNNANFLGMNPLLIVLIAFVATLAIFFGIERLNETTKRED
jgi:hypothetical protein